MVTLKRVTPCVGVWIEIQKRQKTQKKRLVTPCVGVWVEIFLTHKKELTKYGYQVGKISMKEQTVMFHKMDEAACS